MGHLIESHSAPCGLSALRGRSACRPPVVAALRRRQDWPERLADYIEGHVRAGTVFDWTQNNCASFAAGAVAAVTGAQVLPARALAPADEKAAYRALRAYDGALSKACDAVLGARQPAVAARRGDIVLLDEDGRETLAVSAGAKVYLLSPIGLESRPLSSVLACWKVG